MAEKMPADKASACPDEFVRLFMAHERRILAFIVSMLPNLADAEDVLQEVGGVLWQKFDKFEPDSNFAAWAFQTAKLKVYEHRRRQRRQHVVFTDETLEQLSCDASDTSADLELRNRVLAECLNKLSPRDRELVQSRYKAQGTLITAAQRFGRSVVTTRKALRQIHSALFTCIQRKLQAEEA